MSRIELGDTAKDTVTGFKGIVVARTQWMTGCERLTLQPPVDKEGKVPETYTVDEPVCELVKSAKPQTKRNTGGPRPEPVKR